MRLLATLFPSFYLTPLMAFVQEAVPSHWRATAMALCLLIVQVVGGATVGAAVGALSDAVGLQGAMLLPLGAALLGGLVLLLGVHWRLCLDLRSSAQNSESDHPIVRK